MTVLRSFKLTVAYDGTEFSGWQVQPGQPTIQGMLQRALKQVTGGADIQVVGSGRTDSGVHALAQVASCTLPWREEAARLASALNANLPSEIVVLAAVDAPQEFHAIRDAVGKRYRYQLQIGGVRDPFEHRYRWMLNRDLNVDRMRMAAERFVGVHDFASFQAAGSDRKTTVREVRACDLIVQQPGTPSEATHLAIEVEANGFLYNMVRNIVGTLVHVGRDKELPEWIDSVMAACNRDLAGPTAPAHGLFLLRVDYEPFDSPLK
jgi:tRNA pseudouridine38-40 synthase